MTPAYILDFQSIGMRDVHRVGGKNASLGEMITHLAGAGVRVPGGFATTAEAYRDFLGQEDLEGRIRTRLAGLEVDDVRALSAAAAEIRGWLLSAPFPPGLAEGIAAAYRGLDGMRGAPAVAVRSSATAEDLPEVSFAGQQETFLNIRGVEAVCDAVRRVFASLYKDRRPAVSPARAHGFAPPRRCAADTRYPLPIGRTRRCRSRRRGRT